MKNFSMVWTWVSSHCLTICNVCVDLLGFVKNTASVHGSCTLVQTSPFEDVKLATTLAEIEFT